MSNKTTYDELIALINRNAEALERKAEHYDDERYPGPMPQRANRCRFAARELRAILGRATAHNAGIRSIGPSGD